MGSQPNAISLCDQPDHLLLIHHQNTVVGLERSHHPGEWGGRRNPDAVGVDMARQGWHKGHDNGPQLTSIILKTDYVKNVGKILRFQEWPRSQQESC